MGVPISERSVLHQAWPECHEEEAIKEEVELVIIHVSECVYFYALFSLSLSLSPCVGVW